MAQMLTSINTAYDSPAQVLGPTRGTLRIALIQEAWLGDVERQKVKIRTAVSALQPLQPNLIILQELTLYPYACTQPDAQDSFIAEELTGPSYQFACELAKSSGASVVISIYEGAADGKFNTALTVSPAGEILLKTRKTHIPITSGYFEDKYFEPGSTPAQIIEIEGARVGTPTCWDQWFPELARTYGLIDTDLICYPQRV